MYTVQRETETTKMLREISTSIARTGASKDAILDLTFGGCQHCKQTPLPSYFDLCTPTEYHLRQEILRSNSEDMEECGIIAKTVRKS